MIGNALKYRSEAAPRIHVGVRADSHNWVFSVRDNGIGIEPEYHARIFGMFERLHSRSEYDGTGVGLAMCKRICAHLGGRVWVESQVGRGAEFFFTVPRPPEVDEPTMP